MLFIVPSSYFYALFRIQAHTCAFYAQEFFIIMGSKIEEFRSALET